MFPWLLGGGAAIALLTGLATWDVTHKVDHLAYVQLEAKMAASVAVSNQRVQATEARVNAVASAAGQAEAVAQTTIASLSAQLQQKVHTYVTPKQDAAVAASHGCITYGLLRYLDGAATGVDPSTLPLPSGKSDDACAPVEASTVAAGIADNYSTARANARQLDDLEAATRAEIDAINADGAPTPKK
jgi:hypothetical protein